jgi:UDP-glucose 4-epimerase
MQVVAVDDLSGGKVENLVSFRSYGGIFVPGDLSNVSFVNNLFHNHGTFDYVYHIAAYAAEGPSHFIRPSNYENNLLASLHAVNACVNQSPRPKALIFTSSIAAFD